MGTKSASFTALASVRAIPVVQLGTRVKLNAYATVDLLPMVKNYKF